MVVCRTVINHDLQLYGLLTSYAPGDVDTASTCIIRPLLKEHDVLFIVALCRLLQEQEAWVQVLAQYNSMSSAPAADAAQGSAAAAGATPRQELGGSSTQAAGWSAQACATTGNR